MDEFGIVPSEQWQEFCDGFSLGHRGWLVRLWEFHTANLEAGSADTHELAIQDLELLEINPVQDERHIDLQIVLRDADTQVEKRINQILSIMQERDTEGRVSGLRIDSADEQSTIIRFRIPGRTEIG